jgi:hypothetical protein
MNGTSDFVVYSNDEQGFVSDHSTYHSKTLTLAINLVRKFRTWEEANTAAHEILGLQSYTVMEIWPE